MKHSAYCRHPPWTFVLAVCIHVAGWSLTVSAACPRCGWSAPLTATTITVSTPQQLRRALARAGTGTTILLRNGVYNLDGPLNINVPGVVVRGARGIRTSVVLRGSGMQENKVGVAIAIGASDVVLADVTIADVRLHGIQVRGENGVRNVQIHNVRVRDTGQQLLKASHRAGAMGSQGCLVACSAFEYTDHARSDYTNGVDVLGGVDWHVRDCVFSRIRGPEQQRWRAGPAILFWRNSQGTVVERNQVWQCFRGIALGLTSQDARGDSHGNAYLDHEGGVIRNNLVANLQPWADEGIEANAAKGVTIDHNTVFVTGSLPWSISARFPATSVVARNNLTNRPIIERDGAAAELRGNITRAAADWFVSATKGDFRLAGSAVDAVDGAAPIREVTVDLARHKRPVGEAPDVGALEYVPVVQSDPQVPE